MSVKPCNFYDIRSGKPVLIGNYNDALDFLLKNPDLMEEGPKVEKKEAPKQEEQKPKAEKKLGDAFAKWKAATENQGIAFDPKSQAKADIEFLKAIAEYIKDKVSEGAYAFKQFVSDMKDNGVEGVDEFKDDWKKFFDSNVPPTGTTTETGEGEGGDNRRERKVLGRAYRANQSESVKAAIEHVGLDRPVQNKAEALKKARQLVEDVGIEKALEIARSRTLDGTNTAAIYGAVIEDYQNQLNENIDDADKYLELSDKQTLVFAELSDIAEFSGGFIGELPEIYHNTDVPYDFDAKVKEYTKQFGEPTQEVLARLKEAEAALKAANEKIRELESRRKKAIENESVENIAEAISRTSKKTPPSRTILKQLADQTRKLKLSKPSLFSSASPASVVWDAAVEVVATSLDAGDAVAVAIKKGVDSIRKSDWYKALSDEKKTDAESLFKKELAQIEVEGAEVVGDNIKVPHSLMRYYVSQGITDIEEISKAIHDDLKEDNPELTVRQVRDAITKYGQEVGKNKDQVNDDIRKAKQIGKMLSVLEDLQKGIRTETNPKQKAAMTEKARNLKREIDKYFKDSPKSKEEKRLAALQKTLDNLLSGNYENGRDVVDDTPKIKAIKEEINRVKQQLGLIPAKRSPQEIRETTAINAAQKELEDLALRIQNKELQKKKSGTTPILNEELDKLREQIAKKKEQLETMRKDAGIPEMERLAAYKKRVKEQIDEINRRIQEKDFSKKAKPASLQYDQEALELYAEKERAKEKYDEEFERALLAQRTDTEKAIGLFWDIVGLPKSLKSSFDMSAPLRQGIIDVLTNNPLKTAKSFQFMFQSTFDSLNKEKDAQKFYDKWLTELKASKDWPLIKESGLFIAMDNPRLKAREEAFTTNLLKEIPVLEKPIKIGGRTILPGLKISSKSELAYNSFLNHLRVTNFLNATEALRDNGLTFDSHPEEYKAVANFIGITTGRANLGRLEQAAEILNKGLFSPRFMAARLQFINPVYYATMPPAARRMAMIKAGKFFTVAASLLALAAWHYANDDDDETEVELNPLGNKFARLKKGNTTVDFLGGIGSYLQIMAQLATVRQKNKQTGELERLGSRYGNAKWNERLTDFIAGKAAPVPSLWLQYANANVNEDGELVTPFGEKFSPKRILLDLTIPLYLSDLRKIREQHSGLEAAALIGGSFFGMGVNVKGEKELTTTQQAKAIMNPDEPEQKRSKELFKSAIEKNDTKLAGDAIEKYIKAFPTPAQKLKAVESIIDSELSEDIMGKVGIKSEYVNEFFQLYNGVEVKMGREDSERNYEITHMKKVLENKATAEDIVRKYEAAYEKAKATREMLISLDIKNPESGKSMRVKTPSWMRYYEKNIAPQMPAKAAPVKKEETSFLKRLFNNAL
jgi:hypothetical protein